MHNEIMKVCVRIPSARKEELLAIAESWRLEDQKLNARGPGWDAKIIHKIAGDRYGGLLQMFDHHGWTERGSDMMRQVQRRVKEAYGTVENFAEKHTHQA